MLGILKRKFHAYIHFCSIQSYTAKFYSLETRNLDWWNIFGWKPLKLLQLHSLSWILGASLAIEERGITT